MNDFPHKLRWVPARDPGDRVQRGVGFDGDLRAQVAQFGGHAATFPGPRFMLQLLQTASTANGCE